MNDHELNQKSQNLVNQVDQCLMQRPQDHHGADRHAKEALKSAFEAGRQAERELDKECREALS